MCCASNRHNVLIPEVQIENSGGEKVKEHIKSSQKKNNKNKQQFLRITNIFSPAEKRNIA